MSGSSTRDAVAEAARKRRSRPHHHHHRHRQPPLPVPRRLQATATSSTQIALAWRKVKVRHHRVTYDLVRDGQVVARVGRDATFVDRGLRPSTTYRYKVRVRIGRRVGHFGHSIDVRTAPVPPPPKPTLTQAMVDRMFWRAGFGPSAADRAQWIGQDPSALVSHFLTTPYGLAPTTTPPTYQGKPIDPLASDPELMMEWLDRMQRATNPFVERVNFFWHRHWAVSRDGGIPSQFLLAYRDRLRRYSDLAANPVASFHDLALEMTTQDAAMSMYLTGFLNQKNKPNENYAREFMELFTLGVTDQNGNPNYTQADVHDLARAFTGYTLDQSTGLVSFNPALFDGGPKTILGQTGAFDAPGAIAVVLSHPNHGPFLVRKLWSEFIAAPIPPDALASLVATYLSSGLRLAPVLQGILGHPLIYESLAEPDLIKPPVVYTVGVLRALGAPLRDRWQTDALAHMQQQPYHPPNVAGWEGGLSWMTTTTSSARFDLVVRCQQLLPAVADVPGESWQQAVGRAYQACGAPWISPQTALTLFTYARVAPTATAAQRRERQYALIAFILGGPDGQVM